jgi:tellurite methyltransferase
MSESDREKWNKRFREGAYLERKHPSAIVADWAPRLPVGRALDVACGAGRNSVFLAARGWTVDAIDISRAGLEIGMRFAAECGVDVRWIEADLDAPGSDPLVAHSDANGYGLVLVVRYVNMTLLPRLIGKLAVGGTLICEQHLRSTETVVGPSNPAFRVAAGQLSQTVKRLPDAASLDVLHYTEGLVQDPDGRTAALARLVLRRCDAAPSRVRGAC